MKKVALYLLLLLPLLTAAQTSSGPIRISKLEIKSKRSFTFSQGDSSVKVIIDTLIMHDKSKLFFRAKKNADLIINHALIGKNCTLAGSDTKNNGTNINLSANFVELNSLFIDVEGKQATTHNRSYDNGNGGNVALNYLASGKRPQIKNRSTLQYVTILNPGGGATVNAQTEIPIILDQIRRGSAQRPLGQLPQGKVYSSVPGKNGEVTIRPISTLPN